MGARSRLHDPLTETPFWRTRGFVFGVIAIVLLGAAGLTVFLIRTNQRQQMQWRLDDDPGLARLKEDLSRQIAAGPQSNAATPNKGRNPVALWLGRVKEFTVSQTADGSPPVSLLKMQDASLLAGHRSRKDGRDTLSVSGKQYTFGGPQPRPGEAWMVAVWRDGDDNNAIYTAVRTALK